ncbi:MAG: MaoC family dehydratase [Rhodospirillaceae bacterium]|jgi:acyl dehydratase|nr:MaoC family dehydratase [Rhodospirillaceae bacterium]
MTQRYIEDYTVGEIIVTGSFTLKRAELMAFATTYDPQPMHIDEAFAASDGPFHDVIASGFQTLAIAFKLFVNMGYFEGDVALGGPGMNDLRWLAPVFADDTLTNHVTIVEARRSRSKPDRGILSLGHDLRNQRGDTVLTCVTASTIRCRELPS